MNPFIHAVPLWHPAGEKVNQMLEFRSGFTVSDPEKCTLYLRVNSGYALYINGSFVNCGTYSDFPEEKFYDVLPLSGAVRPGENLFSLIACWQGKDSFSVRKYPAEAVWSLWENGQEIFCSQAGIPVREEHRYLSDVPDISSQLAFSFEYNAFLKPGEYAEAADVSPKASAGSLSFLPRPVKKLEIEPPVPSSVFLQGTSLLTGRSFSDSGQETDLPADLMQTSLRSLSRPLEPAVFDLSGSSFSEGAGGTQFTDNDLILDIGSEMVGFPLLDIELPRSAEILMGWGEHLEDGHVRTKIGPRNFAARLQLPAGRTVFFYPYKRSAFRYLELQLYFHEPGNCKMPEISREAVNSREKFTLYYAGMRPVYYPLSGLNLFTCADRLHEQIFKTCMRTLQGCMHDHYEDCPWREQALYTMDSRNQMLVGYYAFEEYDFARASLKLISHGLRKDGYLELINPGKASITIPSFTAIYLIQAEEYLRYSSDREFIPEILPVLEAIADSFCSKIDASGLIPRETDPRYWNFYEWQTGLDGYSSPASGDQVYDAPLQGFVSLALQATEKIEAVLGREDRASRYTDARLRIRQAFHAAFYDGARKCYRSFLSVNQGKKETCHFSELTQSLAVCAGLVPDPFRENVLDLLAHHGKEIDGEPFYDVTLSHTVFKYEALLSRPQLYAGYVFSDIASQYGSMLRRGATTFWETIDGGDAFSNAGSLCHGWSAVPAFIYMKYVLDLRNEGTALPPELTGIHEAGCVPVSDPGKQILYRF